MAELVIGDKKRCSKCRGEKDVSCFSRNRRKHDGFASECKLCSAVYNCMYRKKNAAAIATQKAKFYKLNPEKHAQWRANYYAENKIAILKSQAEYEARNRPKVRERQATYRAKNPERFKERQRAYVERHYERVLDQKRAWRERNPIASKAIRRTQKAARRAKKKNAEGSHTAGESAALMADQGHMCANPHCAADLRIVTGHLDHIVPLVKGGSNDIINLQWLCQPCNNRKHARTQEDWLAREARRAATKPEMTGVGGSPPC